MSGKYDDIIDLPHPEPQTHPRMPMRDRAAQFAPFDALAGYSEAVQETARLTERRVGPDEDSVARLNRRLRCLADALADSQPEVTFLCFIPDEKKAGGAYRRVTGRVRRMDEAGQRILLTDGTAIPMDSIDDLDGPIFQAEEPSEGE